VVTITGTGNISEATHEGKVNLLGEVGGDAAVTLTLPAATGGGARYKFYVSVVNTSNYVIKVNATPGTDIMQGQIITNSTGDAATAAVITWLTGADADTITMNATTQGGVTRGDWVEW